MRPQRSLARVIVADAGWVVALRDPADAHHDAAKAILAGTSDAPALLPALTFAECLVAPARLGVLDQAAVALRAALEIVEPDADAPIRSATVRARPGLRLPDAIVLDTALHHGARAIAASDARLAASAAGSGLNVLAR